MSDVAKIAAKVPHDWLVSTLGHGELVCGACHATNREIIFIGDPNHCPERAHLLSEQSND